jgi:hypothetical protein
MAVSGWVACAGCECVQFILVTRRLPVPVTRRKRCTNHTPCHRDPCGAKLAGASRKCCAAHKACSPPQVWRHPITDKADSQLGRGGLRGSPPQFNNIALSPSRAERAGAPRDHSVQASCGASNPCYMTMQEDGSQGQVKMIGMVQCLSKRRTLLCSYPPAVTDQWHTDSPLPSKIAIDTMHHFLRQLESPDG